MWEGERTTLEALELLRVLRRKITIMRHQGGGLTEKPYQDLDAWITSETQRLESELPLPENDELQKCGCTIDMVCGYCHECIVCTHPKDEELGEIIAYGTKCYKKRDEKREKINVDEDLDLSYIKSRYDKKG